MIFDCIMINNLLTEIHFHKNHSGIGGSGVFYSTPIGAGNGSIYVTSSLVDAYKSAQYWSKYSSQIFPIPE